jgi:predicted CoA-binding protein
MIDKTDKIAVIGASSNPEKYGHIVAKDLIDKGYSVCLVNPKGGELFGLKVYKILMDIAEVIDVAVFGLPPNKGLKVLDMVKDLNIPKVWLQPGSESPAMLYFCKKNGIDCVSNTCIMVQ